VRRTAASVEFSEHQIYYASSIEALAETREQEFVELIIWSFDTSIQTTDFAAFLSTLLEQHI
jgi:hypothetical protein